MTSVELTDIIENYVFVLSDQLVIGLMTSRRLVFLRRFPSGGCIPDSFVGANCYSDQSAQSRLLDNQIRTYSL